LKPVVRAIRFALSLYVSNLEIAFLSLGTDYVFERGQSGFAGPRAAVCV